MDGNVYGRLLVLVVSVSLLASCTMMRAQRAERAQTELLGMSKVDLYACAGVPNRSETVDGVEFLTYEGGGDQSGYIGGGGQSGVGGGGVSLKKRYCNANFVLRDGKVARITYTGRSGGLLTEGEQCAFIVEKCLPDQ